MTTSENLGITNNNEQISDPAEMSRKAAMNGDTSSLIHLLDIGAPFIIDSVS